jgi:hypothetical protein
MSSSIYARLNYSFPDPSANTVIQALSPEVLVQMNATPQFMNAWQQEDVATGNTSGYYVNPMTTVIANIKLAANNLLSSGQATGTTNAITTLISSAYTDAQDIFENTADGFLYHTNRLSNVIPADQNITEPHFETAMGIGKMMMYFTNQSDNIQNNSPILGSFTSLFIEDTLSAYANTSNTQSNLYANTVTFIPMAGTYTSNISLANAQSLANAYYNLNITMKNFRNQDNVFFQNSSLVLNDFNKVNQFSTMGQTESDLIQNYIGSPKLLSRLNANT